MAEQKVGVVTHYFGKIHVAAVDLTAGELHVGDTIHVKGQTSDFTQNVDSMQIEHQAVEAARPGDPVAIKVIEHARVHDEVFKVSAEDARSAGPIGRFMRWFLRLASTRAGAWFFTTVTPPLDGLVLRLSRGRISMAGVAPILLLTTTGARSGQPRSTPLLYQKDGERFVLIASKGGNPRHPAWYHNLRARPEARLLVGGREVLCKVCEAEGEERERLWKLATAYNPGYDTYQARATKRRIPVLILTPASATV